MGILSGLGGHPVAIEHFEVVLRRDTIPFSHVVDIVERAGDSERAIECSTTLFDERVQSYSIIDGAYAQQWSRIGFCHIPVKLYIGKRHYKMTPMGAVLLEPGDVLRLIVKLAPGELPPTVSLQAQLSGYEITTEMARGLPRRLSAERIRKLMANVVGAA